MRTFPESRRRGVWTTYLTAVAIAGVLLMHGFDATAVDLVDSGHNVDAQNGAVIHGLIGLCVFVVAAAGLIESKRRPRTRRHLPPTVLQTVSSAGMDTLSAGGRLRLSQLCILRT